MGKKILSLILISVLILSSFTFAYGEVSLAHAERFKDEIFGDSEQGIDRLLDAERVVLGDIVDTYVSLEDPGLVTGIVRQFIGDTRYENYDFILNFVDENKNYVINGEISNIGGYIANDQDVNFRDAFDNWSGFSIDLAEDMSLEEMSTYFSKFSISLFFLNEAKTDGEVAGIDSFMFEEDVNGDLTLIESVFAEDGMYNEAKTYIDRALDTTFPPTDEAEQAALDLVNRYNDSTQSDKDIVFDFMVRYNLVIEYTPPSGGGGGGGGALPPEEEVLPFSIEINYEDLLKLIEEVEETAEGRTLLALSVNEGEETSALVKITAEVLANTGFDKEIALTVKYNDIEIILSGDSFKNMEDTEILLEKLEGNKFVFETSNEITSTVYMSVPYDGEGMYPSIYRYNEETEEYELNGGYYDEEAGRVRFTLSKFSEYKVDESEALDFSDIDDITWGQEYKDTVNRMSARGYVQGRGEEFDPFTEVTRAEFATMLVRLMDMTDYEGDDIFEDVKSDNWFYDEVAAAYDLGLIEGLSATEFKPNENITREEMAVMASRMLKKKYYLESEDTNLDFTDSDELSTWAVKGAAMVQELGVMTGRTSGEFDPKGLTTRLEAVIVMERLLAK